MKNFFFLLMGMLLLSCGLYAQTTDVIDLSSPGAVYVTFAVMAGAIPVITQLIKSVLKTDSKLVNQIISWATGLVVALFGWKFGLGYLAEVGWVEAVLYGLGASLASNGVFDISTNTIEWFIRLFGKK